MQLSDRRASPAHRRRRSSPGPVAARSAAGRRRALCALSRAADAHAHHVRRRVSRRDRRIDRHSHDAGRAHRDARRARHRRSTINRTCSSRSFLRTAAAIARSRAACRAPRRCGRSSAHARSSRSTATTSSPRSRSCSSTGKNVLIDTSARLGCACSGAVNNVRHPRSSVVALEPPRRPRPSSTSRRRSISTSLCPPSSRTPVDVVAVSPTPPSITYRHAADWHRDSGRKPRTAPIQRPRRFRNRARLVRRQSPPRAVVERIPGRARRGGKVAAACVFVARRRSSPKGVSSCCRQRITPRNRAETSRPVEPAPTTTGRARATSAHTRRDTRSDGGRRSFTGGAVATGRTGRHCAATHSRCANRPRCDDQPCASSVAAVDHRLHARGRVDASAPGPAAIGIHADELRARDSRHVVPRVGAKRRPVARG